MPRALKWGVLGASTIILSKDIDNYAYNCGSNFYESDVTIKQLENRASSYDVFQKLKVSKNVNNKRSSPKTIFLNKKKVNAERLRSFLTLELTFNTQVKYWHFLMARLKVKLRKKITTFFWANTYSQLRLVPRNYTTKVTYLFKNIEDACKFTQEIV